MERSLDPGLITGGSAITPGAVAWMRLISLGSTQVLESRDPW